MSEQVNSFRAAPDNKKNESRRGVMNSREEQWKFVKNVVKSIEK